MVGEGANRPRDLMHLGPVDLTDKSANPAPLGLMGFGMTTVLLNMHNAGWFPLDTMILAMGIFYGGIAQIIVRYHGMEEREYLRDDSLHLLRVVLAYSGLPFIDA